MLKDTGSVRGTQIGRGKARPRLPLFPVSLSGYLDTARQFKAEGSEASPSPLWVTEACLWAGHLARQPPAGVASSSGIQAPP